MIVCQEKIAFSEEKRTPSTGTKGTSCTTTGEKPCSSVSIEEKMCKDESAGVSPSFTKDISLQDLEEAMESPVNNEKRTSLEETVQSSFGEDDEYKTLDDLFASNGATEKENDPLESRNIDWFGEVFCPEDTLDFAAVEEQIEQEENHDINEEVIDMEITQEVT